MSVPQMGPRPYGGCGCSGPWLGCSGCLVLVVTLVALLVAGVLVL